MPQADPPAADGGGDAAEADAEPDDEKSVEVMKLRRKQSMLGAEKAGSTVEGVLRASLEKLCMDILQKHYEDADPDEEEMDEAESAYRAEQKQRADWLVNKARAAFDGAARGVKECVKDLSDAEADATRKALKTQSNWFKLKLEVARTAASVELKNQAVEQQAAYHRQLEAKLGEINEGGNQLLIEANEQLEAAHEKIDALERRNHQLDEAYAMSQQLMAKSEATLRMTEERCVTLAADADDAKQALVDALGALSSKELDISSLVGENLTLGEQVKVLLGAIEEERVAKAEALAEAQEEVDMLRASVIEAQAEAERASMMAEEECKRQVALMAERMKAEARAAMSKGTTRDTDGQLQRLLADLHSLTAAKADVDASLATVRSDWADALDEVKRLKAQLANQPAPAEAPPPPPPEPTAPSPPPPPRPAATSDDTLLLAELDALRGEVSDSRQTLSDALADLGVKTDENISLREHVDELMVNSDDARTQIANARKQLVGALHDLVAKGLAPPPERASGVTPRRMRRRLSSDHGASGEISRGPAPSSLAVSASPRRNSLGKIIVVGQEEEEGIEGSGGGLVTGLASAQAAEAAAAPSEVESSLHAEYGTLEEVAGALASATTAALTEMAASKAELGKALGELGIRVRENESLKEHVDGLVRAAESKKREIAQTKDEVNALLRELEEKSDMISSAVGEKESLLERVRELGERSRRAKEEIDQTKAELQQALTALSGQAAESGTLKEQLAALMAQHRASLDAVMDRVYDAQRQLAELRAEYKVYKVEVEEKARQEAASRAAEVETHRQKVELLNEQAESRDRIAKNEIRELRGQINESAIVLSSQALVGQVLGPDEGGGGGPGGDDWLPPAPPAPPQAQSLSVRVKDLVGRYVSTRETLLHLLSELRRQVEKVEVATKAKEAADLEKERTLDWAESRAHRMEQDHRNERQALVKAALRSLAQLRNHVQLTAPTLMSNFSLTQQGPATTWKEVNEQGVGSWQQQQQYAHPPLSQQQQQPSLDSTMEEMDEKRVDGGGIGGGGGVGGGGVELGATWAAHLFSPFASPANNNNTNSGGISSRPQTAGSRPQTAGSRPQTAGSRPSRQSTSPPRDFSWDRLKHRWGIVAETDDTTVISFEARPPRPGTAKARRRLLAGNGGMGGEDYGLLPSPRPPSAGGFSHPSARRVKQSPAAAAAGRGGLAPTYTSTLVSLATPPPQGIARRPQSARASHEAYVAATSSPYADAGVPPSAPWVVRSPRQG